MTKKQKNMTKEYIVLSRSNGTTRTGSPYAMLRVASQDETLNISVWDLQPTAEPKVGGLVRFHIIREGAAGKSCSATDILPGGMPEADHPLYFMLPRPIAREVWDKSIATLISYCTDTQLIDIIHDFANKLYTPYSKYPAATSVHHAYPGGLLNHTHQMLHLLEGLYPCLPYQVKVERIILAILFHDYGKVYEYNTQGEAQPDMYLLGHIFLSAHKLHNVLEEKGIEADEVKRIVHCILAHHGTREFGSPVLPCTQEAILVGYIDNISAKTDIIENATNMESCHFLGTHIVKD